MTVATGHFFTLTSQADILLIAGFIRFVVFLGYINEVLRSSYNLKRHCDVRKFFRRQNRYIEALFIGKYE